MATFIKEDISDPMVDSQQLPAFQFSTYQINPYSLIDYYSSSSCITVSVPALYLLVENALNLVNISCMLFCNGFAIIAM